MRLGSVVVFNRIGSSTLRRLLTMTGLGGIATQGLPGGSGGGVGFGVEGVAEGVAEGVKGEEGGDEESAGEEEEPGGGFHVVGTFLDEGAPGGLRGLDAEAEEA